MNKIRKLFLTFLITTGILIAAGVLGLGLLLLWNKYELIVGIPYLIIIWIVIACDVYKSLK